MEPVKANIRVYGICRSQLELENILSTDHRYCESLKNKENS